MKKITWREVGIYTGILYLVVGIYFVFQMFQLGLLKPLIQWSLFSVLILLGAGLIFMAISKKRAVKVWGNALLIGISMFLWIGAIGLDAVNSLIDDITVQEEQQKVQEEDVQEKEESTENMRPFDVTEDTFTVLITGIDTYGEIDKISRSDVNILAVVNPKKAKVLLVSIPRDYYVPIYSGINSIGSADGRMDKLTHTGLFGPQCTARTLEKFFDIPIRYYVRVNFTSLIDIVDAVGGITVQSEYAFDDFVVGANECDGKRALEFARERYAFQSGDRQRGKNQMKVIEAVITKVTNPSLQYDYVQLLQAVIQSLQMNFSDKEIKDLLQMQLSEQPKWTIESISVNGTGGRAYSYYGNQELYMMYPDEVSVENAKAKMSEYQNME